MAAGGMTKHDRVCVVQFPSLMEAGWVEAIRRHANDIGWSVHDLAIEADWPTAPLTASAIFFTTGSRRADDLDPTHWVILTDNPSASASLVSRVVGGSLYDQATLVHTSVRLAFAAQIAASKSSVEVLDARARRLRIGEFGEVERTLQPDLLPGRSPAGPLDIFKALPIPIDAAIDWGPSIFSVPSGATMDAGSPEIDLTGRARMLLFGPSVCLPVGSWSVQMDLSIEPQASPVVLMFEWGGEDDFVSHTASVVTAGRYSITLSRYWTDVRPAQIRLWLTQPLFQGNLVFHGCRLQKMPGSTPETTIVANGMAQVVPA